MFKSRLIWIPVAAVALSVVLVGSAVGAPILDTTPPDVAWLSTDLSGVVVNGRTMTVSASDDTAVTSVTFSVNGAFYADGTDNGDGTWSAEFDTAGYPEGPVEIIAAASDAALNVRTTAPIDFTDSHDDTAPVLNSTTPADGAVVSGTVHFVANATDDYGVTSVSYSTDAESTWQAMTVDGGDDYSADIDTGALEGDIVFLRLADAAGNVTIGTVGFEVQTAPQLETDSFEIGNFSNADFNATPQVGDYLGVSGGVASGTPDPTISYLWQICHPGAACTTATGSSYVVQGNDVGADITVTVIADNGIGTPATLPHDFGTVPAPVIDIIPADAGPQSGPDPTPTAAPAPSAPAALPAAAAPATQPATPSTPVKSGGKKGAKTVKPRTSAKPSTPAKPTKSAPAKGKSKSKSKTTSSKPTTSAKPAPAKGKGGKTTTPLKGKK